MGEEALLNNLGVFYYILLTKKDFTDPSLVPVIPVEMTRMQLNGHFCRDIVARQYTGQEIAFSKGEGRILFCLAHGAKQIDFFAESTANESVAVEPFR